MFVDNHIFRQKARGSFEEIDSYVGVAMHIGTAEAL
jgi:hypothetical protein